MKHVFHLAIRPLLCCILLFVFIINYSSNGWRSCTYIPEALTSCYSSTYIINSASESLFTSGDICVGDILLVNNGSHAMICVKLSSAGPLFNAHNYDRENVLVSTSESHLIHLHRTSNWCNYGNSYYHRSLCECGDYIYTAHIPDSEGTTCSVCGATNIIV